MAPTTRTDDQLSERRIAAILGILPRDVEKPLTASDIVALKPFRQDVEGGEPVPMKLDTWWGYVGKGKKERAVGRDRPSLAPAPDGYVGRSAYWWPETIARYVLNRPGRGVGGGQPSHRRNQAA